MKNGFEYILENYLEAKTEEFANNQVATFLRQEFPSRIRSAMNYGSKYKVSGSAGQGNWVEIPWIAIFDKEITISAQTGFYIVYLFDSEMGGVYLSLNQGWTQYQKKFGSKEGKKQIKKVTRTLQGQLRTIQNDFSKDEINLNAKNILGKGYELGHVCGKYYPKDRIPENEELIEDLRGLTSVYREIKGIVGLDIFDIENIDLGEDIEPSNQEMIDVNKTLNETKTDEDILSALTDIEEKFGAEAPQVVHRIARAISRNSKLAKLVKKRDEYTCQICGEEGFEKTDGEKYIEVHHLVELGNSGLDVPSNIISVCPTCHKVIHYGSKSAQYERKAKKN